MTCIVYRMLRFLVYKVYSFLVVLFFYVTMSCKNKTVFFQDHVINVLIKYAKKEPSGPARYYFRMYSTLVAGILY
jgi:hypothetical protein